jgi:hypothetical protein
MLRAIRAVSTIELLDAEHFHVKKSVALGGIAPFILNNAAAL